VTLHSPSGARPVTIVVLLGIALIHFLTLPSAFETEAYVGVGLILASGMTLAGAVALLARNRDGVWWYALFQGVLTTFGYLVTRLEGLPLVSPALSGDWDDQRSMALVFCGLIVTGLAGWVLYARHAASRRPNPVTSARERVHAGAD
jgi:hypothetical protein